MSTQTLPPRTLDEPDVRGHLRASWQEIPREPIVTQRWSDRRRTLRPRFVAASVVVGLSAVAIIGAALGSLASPIAGGWIALIGAMTILGVLGAVMATWPRHRVSPLPRLLAACVIGAVSFATTFGALHLIAA